MRQWHRWCWRCCRATSFHRLWGSDTTVSFPDDGSRPDGPSYFPPVGGFRFGFFTIPPDGGAGAPADLDFDAALAEFEEKLPGMAEHLEPEHPGMHTTATVDYGIVLSGEPILELDDGVKLTLRPGTPTSRTGRGTGGRTRAICRPSWR